MTAILYLQVAQITNILLDKMSGDGIIAVSKAIAWYTQEVRYASMYMCTCTCMSTLVHKQLPPAAGGPFHYTCDVMHRPPLGVMLTGGE